MLFFPEPCISQVCTLPAMKQIQPEVSKISQNKAGVTLAGFVWKHKGMNDSMHR